MALRFGETDTDVDPFGFDPIIPVGGGRGGRGGLPTPLNRAPRIIDPVVTPEVPVPGAFEGSPLNTMYGVDDESFLTDDQRKLARMIQGQFDASTDRRDRELARYGAPALANFANDEAMARAMALARGLNFKEKPEPEGGQGTRASNAPNLGGAPGRFGDLPRVPVVAEKPPNYAGTNAQWQRILSGLTSVLPLLFGKDAFGNFLNKGAIGWLKEKMFGSEAAQTISDEQLERLLDSQGANNSWDILPAPSVAANGSWDVLPPPAGAAWDANGDWDMEPPIGPGVWEDWSGDIFDPYAIGGW